MRRTIEFSGLMDAAGIAGCSGSVDVNEQMSGLEPEPKDDWLYLGLRAIREVAVEKGERIRSIACIGSANGIDSIGILRLFPRLRKLWVTDILPGILPEIRRNVEKNAPSSVSGVDIEYCAGRDCEPVGDKVDLIYANLPLIMVDPSELDHDLATTTLTDAQHYLDFGQGEDDLLRRWSLLSQLGFLLSAKNKLNPGGSIITLIGGRVPYEAILELSRRSGLVFRERSCAFKRQSDPQFIREYADYERKEGVDFCFYDYLAAAEIIREKLGVTVPDVVPCRGDQLKSLIAQACLNARQAFAFALTGRAVGHIAFAFEAVA